VSSPGQQHAPIIGRDTGLARLRGLVDPAPPASRVLLVTGAAGMGKTVLLADAADRARQAGWRVLAVTGRESEARLAFAGLHQLLRPVLSRAAGLPGRQARALLVALGLSADPGAADPLLTGVAVLTLLSDLSGHSPVLVVADDAHWLDRSSLRTASWRAHCTTSRTGEPGTWRPRPCNPTNTSLRCSRPQLPRRNAAAGRRPPRWPWNARPSSAPTRETRPAGW
jgi:hypothetical protein